MKETFKKSRFAIWFNLSILLFAVLPFSGCDNEDPKPVHEPEVITTVEVTLLPDAGGIPVTLKFFDADGEQGNIAPLITVSGPLKAGSSYSGVIELWNETVNPPANITEEVAEEANDHLFCFNVSGDITIGYEDEDANGFPIGVITSWSVGEAGPAEVTVSLRHQAGTKTGDCPGNGETDVEVTFDIDVN
ncbi:MAG TPA: hypothetical protein VFT90_06865 [Chryseosolibacter sp.]|nr:hypothetical protein [Chryseosolibacter sp.]